MYVYLSAYTCLTAWCSLPLLYILFSQCVLYLRNIKLMFYAVLFIPLDFYCLFCLPLFTSFSFTHSTLSLPTCTYTVLHLILKFLFLFLKLVKTWIAVWIYLPLPSSLHTSSNNSYIKEKYKKKCCSKSFFITLYTTIAQSYLSNNNRTKKKSVKKERL